MLACDEKIVKQFCLLCLSVSSNVVIDSDFRQAIRSNYQLVEEIYRDWISEINNSRFGYPRVGEINLSPFIEDRIRIFLSCIDENSKVFWDKPPRIILSHDIDYLYPTIPLELKRRIFRGFKGRIPGRKSYIKSIEKYLEEEKNRNIKSTLFVCFTRFSKSPFHRLKQWVFDPSYSQSQDHMQQLKSLVNRYGCEIGIHGSILSLEKSWFIHEKNMIEEFFEKNVRVSRQHWLHIPNFDSLKQMYDAGIRVDSTLGWNGKLGFRCGMARPYIILLDADRYLFEVPMLLMDGVLFDELGLNEDDAFTEATKILETVKCYKGTVSINWHGRTFSEDYNWGNLYCRLIDWAKNEGFEFVSYNKIERELEEIVEHVRVM